MWGRSPGPRTHRLEPAWSRAAGATRTGCRARPAPCSPAGPARPAPTGCGGVGGQPRSAPALPPTPVTHSQHPEQGKPGLPRRAGHTWGAEGGTPDPPGRALTPWVPGPSSAVSPASARRPGRRPRAAPAAAPRRGTRPAGCSATCSSGRRFCSWRAHPAGDGSVTPPATRCPHRHTQLLLLLPVPFTFPWQSAPPAPPKQAPHLPQAWHTLQSSSTRLRQAVFPVPGAPEM